MAFLAKIARAMRTVLGSRFIAPRNTSLGGEVRPSSPASAVDRRPWNSSRDGAKRPRSHWKSAIRQGLGRGRRGGSATGPI